MAGTLYTYPNNFRAQKVLIAAQFSGAEVNVVSEPPQFVLGETNKSAAFLEKFPLGKVPAFETKDGKPIYESNAIAYYVSNETLKGGSDNLLSALVQQYVAFADNEILPSACVWVYPTYGLMQYNKDSTEKAKAEIRKCLSVLNKVLERQTYLVGERVTLADITVACNLLMLYQQVLDPDFRAPFSNVNRWFATLVNQPQFKAVLGEVTLCTTMAQFDAAKFQAVTGGKGKKDKKEKQPEKKGKEKKKESEKKKEEEPTEEPDATDEALADQPKKKDPFGHLPKSPFVLDAWKRTYSNEDTVSVAIPYFWENFDAEGYSLWFAEYQYPEELKKIFMACNLVGGMFQRLDSMRKYSFGSVLIFGADGDISISGVWMLRGQELAFEVNDDWNIDAGSYKFTKLDPTSDETKKLVNAYWAWEGDFGGKKMNQGKVFK